MAIYGIDLGTTDSCIAYVDDTGRPVVLKSALGEDKTPSVVYFESQENVVVGRQAKDFAALAPNLVVEQVKRRMGQDVHYMFHGQQHTPESVSALILRELARAAQEQTGEVVQDVIITVPAYFGVLEREATRNAGQIAGLNVLDVLAEPVAAALAYQAVGHGSGVRNILVYDLGGGTFDTTVIRIDEDDVRVLCVDGDSRLGGADWDAKISDFLLRGFTGRYPQLDPGGDEKFMQDLATSAEQLKKALSAVRARRHNVRFDGLVVQLELTREQLEQLTSELLERTLEITGRTIATGREMGVERFDDVLLVGGMTNMPTIARTLRDRFGLEGRRQDPQLAVAKGAALFALMRRGKVSLASDSESGAAPGTVQDVADQLGISAEQVKALAAKRVATVVPRAFGLKVADSEDPLSATDPDRARHSIAHLLMANTPLPADAGPHTFQTVVDNQREVVLEVWEQAGSVASPEVEHNTLIAQAVLGNLPPLPVGTPIEVVFHMTETGLLTVHGREVGSGREVRFETQVGALNETEVQYAKSAVASYAVSELSPEELKLVRTVAEREARRLEVSETPSGELAEQMLEVLGYPEATRRLKTSGPGGTAASGAELPTGMPDPMQHYLVAEMPARIPVMADVSLVVRITADLPGPPRLSASLKGFKPEPDGTAVTVIVQAPAQLRPMEALEQVIVVPPSGDSEPTRFAFRAEQPGLFKVRVTAFIGGTFVGELGAEISVEANGQRVDGHTLVADLGHLRPEPGEVTLQVRFDGDRYTFQLLSDSCLFGPVLAEALTAQPGEAVERTLAMLRAMADRRSGYTARNARRWMREAGIGLWNDMVPGLIKEQFWQLRSSIAAFSIVCARDTIPWELLYPLAASGEDAGFLVDQFPVLRRVYDQRRSRYLSLRPASYVVPPRPPTNAPDEVAALQRKLGAAADAIGDLETLMALIDSGDFGMLHFACHNTFKADGGGSLIAMAGGPFVPALLNGAVTTRALAARSPIVFINGCRSAADVPEYTQLLGWAGQFMAAGAGAFIGTLWAVPSDSARVFAEAFYDCLKASRTLGEAVQEGRQAVADDTADPTWLAYSIYGDPAATVTAD
jgi:molecular chaperone DnaK